MFLLNFICFLFLLFLGFSMKLDSDFTSDKNWDFYTKFCFDQSSSNYGNFTWDITTDSVFYQFDFYDDSSNSWEDVYHSSDSCSTKSSKAIDISQIESKVPGFDEFLDISRPRFWYFAVSNCPNNRISLTHVDVHIWNSGASKLNKEFSCNEQGLVVMFLIFMIIFIIMLSIYTFESWKLFKEGNFHALARISFLALVFETVGLICVFAHFAAYANDGKGSFGLRVFGELLEVIASIILMLFVILVAKGWTISRSYISYKKVLFGVILVLLVLYIIMHIVGYLTMDRATTTYIWETTPGIMILVIRILILIWFIFEISNTFKIEKDFDKKKFYKVFGFIFGIWFISLPIIVSISSTVSNTYREKTATALFLIFEMFSYFIVIYLLWPAKTYHFFNIQAKTTEERMKLSKTETAERAFDEL
ncbi:intimal thickness receptor-related [Anaeramoeba ignava]|uniref:Intimal thickness receptor-related n=1 Tax=Anaeramoeba ignava TaxID=1746090 RepID=A0A9Q0LIT7_ANAIG|nr:intimal thickness receptor-related [Anaeramoeba ignava]